MKRINKQLFKESSLSRRYPGNTNLAERSLFAGELERGFPEVNVVEVSNAFIVNGGNILDGSLSPACEFSQTSSHLSSLRERLSVIKRIATRRTLKLDATYYWAIDSWSHNYFHWLTEALLKMFMLEKYLGVGVVLLPDYFKDIAFVKATLPLLDSSVVHFNHEVLVKAKALTTVTYPALTGNYNPLVFPLYRDWLLGKVSSTGRYSYDNIYISRRKAAVRRVVNEEEVVGLLSRFGFVSFCLEEYEWKEQVDIFRNARNIISIHGAGLTNCIFSKEARVLEFRKMEDATNNCYYALCDILGHEYYYQLDDPTYSGHEKSDYYIDVHLLEQNVRSHLKLTPQ